MEEKRWPHIESWQGSSSLSKEVWGPVYSGSFHITCQITTVWVFCGKATSFSDSEKLTDLHFCIHNENLCLININMSIKFYSPGPVRENQDSCSFAQEIFACLKTTVRPSQLFLPFLLWDVMHGDLFCLAHNYYNHIVKGRPLDL